MKSRIEWQVETSLRPAETNVFASFEDARKHVAKLGQIFAECANSAESSELRIWLRRVVRHKASSGWPALPIGRRRK